MKPKVLITNDDGIFSRGLKTLWESVAGETDPTIVAPAFDQSGKGLGISFRTPLHIEQVDWEKGSAAWKVNGTPADCVKLALAIILEQKPDLVISGINRGSNAGRTVLYSGTVGGVIEGAMRGIPGIAFSYEEQESPDAAIPHKYVLPLIRHVLEHPLPHGTFLNVTFPFHTIPLKGIKLARQGKGYWLDDPSKRIHPDGDNYYWLGGRWADQPEEDNSDVALLRQGYITVVPIHVGELTDHAHLAYRKEAFERLFP